MPILSLPAYDWGSRGRRFKSCRSDQKETTETPQKSKLAGFLFVEEYVQKVAVCRRVFPSTSDKQVTNASTGK
jgi:hypothetical protein